MARLAEHEAGAIKGEETTTPLLKLKNIFLQFGGVIAIDNVSLEVEKGGILAIIGPNGAGKTSLLNCINGLYHPQKGQIFFQGQEVTPLKPSKRAALGIARTFQHVELFKGMTVLDNIKLGRHIWNKSGFLGSIFRMGKALEEEMRHRVDLEEKIIDFLDLSWVRESPVSTLPHGLQKRVDLARALAMNPKLLLMDEPMAGMNSEEKEDMASFFLDVHRELGTTIIWIEHDLSTVMDLSETVCVLNFGQKIADGTPEQVQKHPAVIDAYLGGAAE